MSLNVSPVLPGGFPPEVVQNFLEAFKYYPFVPGKLMGREFQRQGFAVARVPQMVQETGQGEDAVAGEEVLLAVAVIGEMDVPDPAGAVEEIEIVDEVGLARPHVGAVEGLEKVPFGYELDHLFGLGQDILVHLELPRPGHVFDGHDDRPAPHFALEILHPVHLAPEPDLAANPGGRMEIDQGDAGLGGKLD